MLVPNVVVADLRHETRHTIAKLLNFAHDHHDEPFSRAFLEAFKSRAGVSTADLARWMAGVPDPTDANIRVLKKAVKRPRAIFEETYETIRHRVFGHAVITRQFEVEALFSKTNFIEIDELLHGLHDVMAALFDLLYNGQPPTLGTTPYGFVGRTREATFKALGAKLPAIRRRRKIQ